MKILNKLLKDVSNKETYKQQFVINDLKNILFVDPILSSQDLYNLIIPAITINSFNIANVAFTNISKFVDDSDKQIFELSGSEISWSDVIVFPFYIERYMYEDESLFIALKKIKPSLKIIFLVDVNFWNPQFSSQIEKHKSKQQQFSSFINENIKFNIRHCDKVLVHNENLKKSLESYLSVFGDETKIETNYFVNNYDMITEGFSRQDKRHDKEDYRLNIYVELLDEKDIHSFVKNIVDKSNSKCNFYIQTNEEITNPKITTKKPITITHWYKEVYSIGYDYMIIYGTATAFTKSKFLSGKIIDCAFLKCHTIINSKSIFDYLDNETKDLCSCLNAKEILKLINEETDEDYQKRLTLAKKSKTNSLKFEIQNKTEAEIENYKKIFLD